MFIITAKHTPRVKTNYNSSGDKLIAVMSRMDKILRMNWLR